MALAIAAPLLLTSLVLAQDQDREGAPQRPAEGSGLRPDEIIEMREGDCRDVDLETFMRERVRLYAWLACSGNRAKVLADPIHVHEFYRAPRGPYPAPVVRWYPQVHRYEQATKRWDHAAERALEADSKLVALFGPSDVERPPANPGDTLVSLVPIHTESKYFALSEFDPKKLGPSLDLNGNVNLTYALRPNRTSDYADWTERLVQRPMALVCDGVVVSMPTIMSRIPGHGVLAGGAVTEERIIRWVKRAREADTTWSPTRVDPTDPATLRATDVKSVRTLDSTLRATVETANAAAEDRARPTPLSRVLGKQITRDATFVTHGIAIPVRSDTNRHRFLLVPSLWAWRFGDPDRDQSMLIDTTGDLDLTEACVVAVEGKIGRNPVVNATKVTRIAPR